MRELATYSRLMTVRMHYNAQQHFVHVYHHSRSDLDTGADGCAEGDGSRPCAGGGVILWERALLAWGMEMSLGEPAKVAQCTRAKDEKGGPDASTDADVLPARRSCPPAVAAGRNGRPEMAKSPAQSRAARAQSADAFRLA